MLGRAVLVSEDNAFLGDFGVHSHGDGLLCILQVAYGDVVPRERRVDGCDLLFRNEFLIFVVTGRSLLSRPDAGDPELTEDQGGRDA